MLKGIKSLYKKELLDIIRDKKSMIIMFLVPLIVYPLLFAGSMYAVTFFINKQEEATYVVGFQEVLEQDTLEQVMKKVEESDGYKFKIMKLKEDGSKLLEKGDIDLLLTSKQNGEKVEYQLKYRSTKNSSTTAANHMSEVIEQMRVELSENTIKEAGLDVESVLYPVSGEKVDTAPTEESMGNILGSILPFLLIISIVTGAIYPAIDTTAGEKERGTLETLLTLPVSNFQMIMSKFLSVSTMASVSALLNFVSVSIIGIYFYQSFSVSGNGTLDVNMNTLVPAFLIMLLCVIVFAMLISALCLCFCLFAKSFKEAQNYTTPLMLVIMVCGYVGFIPDIALDSRLAVVPVVNIVLLLKDILVFKYSFYHLFLVFITNVVYSFIVVFILSKMYNSESLLYNDGNGMKLFQRRSEQKNGQMPGIADAILLLSVALLVQFYVGSIVVLKIGFAGIALEQLLFLVLTIGFAWYMRVDFKKLFSIKIPKVRHVFGGILLAVGAFLTTLLLSDALAKILPDSASNLEEMGEMFNNQPVAALFLVVAVLPAVCEEALFRGFLFGSMKEKWKPVTAIVVSGIIFGVYHMSLIKAVTISIFGIALAFAVECSGCIFVSMLMHFCNNGVSVMVSSYPKQMEKMLPFLFETKTSVGVYIGMTVAAILFALAGIMLLREKSNTKQ